VHEDWSVSASDGRAEANINLTVLLNGVVVFNDAGSAGGATGVSLASKDATVPLTIALEPGFNSLVFIAEADGLAATPEPATLILVGTTAAGLGLAGWRQRRHKQQR
jgi:hypothetical protein